MDVTEELLKSSFLVPKGSTRSATNTQPLLSNHSSLGPSNVGGRNQPLLPTAKTIESPSLVNEAYERSTSTILPSLQQGHEDNFLKRPREDPLSRLVELHSSLREKRAAYQRHVAAAQVCAQSIDDILSEIEVLLSSRKEETSSSKYSSARSSVSPNTSFSPSSSVPSSPSPKTYPSVTVKKFFQRKARCLLFLPDSAMVTSSLDGAIQFSSLEHQALTKSLLIPALLERVCFVEDACYVPSKGGIGGNLVFATSESSSLPENQLVNGQAPSLIRLPWVPGSN